MIHISSPALPSDYTSNMTDQEILKHFGETCCFVAERGRPLMLDAVFLELLARAGIKNVNNKKQGASHE